MLLQAGTYQAKVSQVTLEVIGEKNYPVLKVEFKPHKYRNGSVFVDFDGNKVDKLYFLSTDIATKGSQAGRSKLEILRDELKSVYDYTLALRPESLQSLIGKELEIVVELNDKGYPQVRWVNAVGKKRGGTAKPLPLDILAKLSAAFMGESGAVSPKPSDFFANLAMGVDVVEQGHA